MSSETILYIILAGILALFLALFQYFKKEKSMSKLNMLFSFLRFLSIFSVLLLIVNPSFKQIQLIVEKPNLAVVLDNSSSIKYLNRDKKALECIETIKTNAKLKEKFNLDFYTFGDKLTPLETVTFSEKQTNIYEAFKQLSQVYKQNNAPTILITDGNQTYGNDYQFVPNTYHHPIYPIILGDTVSYTDLKIQQLNVNRYAYLKNEFPVETILVYNGVENISSKFIVSNANGVVYSEIVNFSKNKNSKVVHFNLPASKVGVSKYKAEITPLSNEKNKVNNVKKFAIEVVDQKTKIAIVSSFFHPDIGTLKKSIESNEQRFVSIVSPEYAVNNLNDFQLVIVYQPNYSFNNLYNVLKNENKNFFTVIGTKTDLNFVNQTSEHYKLNVTKVTENYQAQLNTNYSPFIISDIDFESFPPLLSNYGDVTFNVSVDVLLNKKVGHVETNQPLLATFENNTKREAVLLGENIWKWRMQNYLNHKSFEEFDDFIGRLIQYLSSNKPKKRLNIDYESFYNGNNNVIIKADFFDKNYVFDNRETLHITVKDRKNKTEKIFPLILKNNYYQVDLGGLKPSEYDFFIKATNENISSSGSFEIIEYNVEQQFLNANVSKLKNLALKSSGESYFIDDASQIINKLLRDKRYMSIQKSTENNISLIHWKYLLAIIVLSLGIEWFLRKYNGLI